jgi:ribosomal protein S27E
MKCECGSENIRARCDVQHMTVEYVCRDCGEYIVETDYGQALVDEEIITQNEYEMDEF